MAAIPVALVSYGWAGLSYLGLTLWLAERQRRGLQAQRAWLYAAATTCLSSVINMRSQPGAPDSLAWWSQAELASKLCWLLLLSRCLGLRWRSLPRRACLALLGLTLCLGVGYSTSLAALVRLCLALLGLVLVEQLFRSHVSARWSVKFLALGCGMMFAYDLYLYSDALLLRQLDVQLWSVRGAVDAISAFAIAVAITRKPVATMQWQLSRQVLGSSVAILGSACYLLSMSLAAWALRTVGGRWGLFMQLVCLAGASVLLAAILCSGAAQARLKVWVSKHFYRGHYDYRREWQLLSKELSDASLPLHERAIMALARLVDSPAGVLWRVDGQGRFQPAYHWNMAMPEREFGADALALQHMAERGWVMEAHALGW